MQEGNLHVRVATLADAPSICLLLRQSITHLCLPDHDNDAEALSRWLANKTPENIEQWIANPENMMPVVEVDDSLVAAGCVTTGGEIGLNYVSPSARFRGVSKGLMSVLEKLALASGIRVVTLESTATAYRFYKSIGYEDRSAPVSKHGLPTFPMQKCLTD